MDILIKNAIILHKSSEFHQKKVDIHVVKGRIKTIGEDLDVRSAHIISGNALYCTIGLCDIGTHCGEPGYEHRETIGSMTRSALAGGYTSLAIFPNNKPVTQTRAAIRYIKTHADANGVKLFPIGALSKDLSGTDIAEYLDMHAEGVIAFSDGIKAIHDTGLLSRALQYATSTQLPIIHHPDDHHLSDGGEMHEGEMSTSLGMKGVPDIAELNMVQRDILIQSYNGGTVIEHAVSAASSVAAMKNAQKQKQNVFATVAYMNLLHTDQDLFDFDSNLKVLPVLRSEVDRKALIKGLKDGTIDAIVSNHTPLDEEAKKLEYPYATPGAIGLETCLAATIEGLAKDMDLDDIIHKLTIGPRQLLNLEVPEIVDGAMADLCVFDTDQNWTYHIDTVKSMSCNSPYLGKMFKTKVLATIIG